MIPYKPQRNDDMETIGSRLKAFRKGTTRRFLNAIAKRFFASFRITIF